MIPYYLAMKLKVQGAENRINFSAAHFIPSIEKCSRLHGHDYAVDLELEGEPRDGILIDYGIVKGAIRALVDTFDHKVLLPENSPLTKVTCDHKECSVSYNTKRFLFPVSDVYMLERSITSSEMIADYLADQMREKLKQYKNLTGIRVCVFEGPGQCTCQELPFNAD